MEDNDVVYASISVAVSVYEAEAEAEAEAGAEAEAEAELVLEQGITAMTSTSSEGTRRRTKFSRMLRQARPEPGP